MFTDGEPRLLSVLMLVFALQGGGWQCQENDRGLWECRVPTRKNAVTAPGPVPSPTAPAATDTAVASEQPLAASAPVADREEPLSASERSFGSTASAPVTGRESVPASVNAPARVETSPSAQAAAVDPISRDEAAPLDGAELNAFVVQIGAFRSEQRARRAVRDFGLPQLAIIPTRRGDEDWYVILLGTYPDLEAATEAGRSFVEASPGASYWVRNAAELRRILKP